METIASLLDLPDSPAAAAAIVSYVQGLRGRVLRGDMVIGILSIEEIERVPSALEWAAAHGEPTAWLELAKWSAHPPFGEADPERMERALRSAREAGAEGADLELVILRWFFRRSTCTPKEQSETAQILRDLVAAKPTDAVATYYLGLLTSAGFGMPPDPTQAVAILQTAAELGNRDAMFELSLYYDQAIGVTRDSGEALLWLRRAAEAGQPRAMYNLGASFAAGRHGRVDLPAAIWWYGRASEEGNARATAMLGAMYARGEGVERDEAHALELFDQAEELGFDTFDLRLAVGCATED